jgi:predicted metalloprotease with PDZ domain
MSCHVPPPEQKGKQAGWVSSVLRSPVGSPFGRIATARESRRWVIALYPARCVLGLLVLLIGSVVMAPGQQTAGPVMTLVVDETQEARRIAFVHEEIPVRPGALVLAYPAWIPGEHGPTGPIQQFADLRIHVGSTTLAWSRDPDNIFTFHVELPAGTDRVMVDFDTLLENTLSDHQLLLAWNTVVVYPLGFDKRNWMIAPSVLLPPNWKQGSSLQVTHQTDTRVDFAPISLERLIDSPLLAGEFFRAVPLTASWPAELDITGDSQAAVDHADDAHAFALFSKLVDEDQALFGFRHWRTLHLLVSQTGTHFYDGLEHEDSPWDGMCDAGLSKKQELERFGWPLLAHEQSHSWDGKYRRPQELYSKPDFQGPERTSLLWVYEGLNTYIGMLLATRAGFNDPVYLRDYLARTAANLTNEPGRASSALVDTATANWILRTGDSGWSSLRRRQDYYDEGALMWLGADVLIRKQSQGRVSLDDFLRSFFGQRDTDAIVVPYTREDVEAGLSAIWPYDWHKFIEQHVYQVNPQPPTDGLQAAGWQIVYNSTPNNKPYFADFVPIEYYGSYSVGMDVNKDGSIWDVWPGTPAYDAGLGPHMTILAVDGRAYSADALDQSIAQPRDGKISLLVRNFETVETREIHYAEGVRYPHLARIPGSHDYLSDILAPRSNEH